MDSSQRLVDLMQVLEVFALHQGDARTKTFRYRGFFARLERWLYVRVGNLFGRPQVKQNSTAPPRPDAEVGPFMNLDEVMERIVFPLRSGGRLMDVLVKIRFRKSILDP